MVGSSHAHSHSQSQIQGGGGGGESSSSSSSRSKEAVGMMALHEALRTVCSLNSDWTYSVFWTIRPRPRIRGGNGCKVGDDNGSLMLMWEDGYCRGGGGGMEENNNEGGEDEDAVRKAFSKMSIQLYNYGEGLMGKVASDKCHKWVFKEPTECEPNISNYWQSSFDALPSEWTDQFESGIQTIAVIQAGHGLLQLGSCKIIPEDLHFVLRMRHTFESLGFQSGYYLSQLFSSTRNSASSTSIPSKTSNIPIGPPPPLLNWAGAGQRPNNSMIPPPLPPNFHNPVGPTRAGFPQHKDEHLFMLPSEPPRIEDMMMGGEHHQHHPHPHHQHHNQHQHESSNDIKWPDGLSFFNALTGRTEDGKMLFNLENLGNKPHSSSGLDHEFLSLDSNADESGRKADNNKFKRSFTLPLRMASSSSSATSVDHHHHLHQQMEYRNSEAGMYTDPMDTYLE